MPVVAHATDREHPRAAFLVHDSLQMGEGFATSRNRRERDREPALPAEGALLGLVFQPGEAAWQSVRVVGCRPRSAIPPHPRLRANELPIFAGLMIAEIRRVEVHAVNDVLGMVAVGSGNRAQLMFQPMRKRSNGRELQLVPRGGVNPLAFSCMS